MFHSLNSVGERRRQAGVQIPALSLTSCVDVGLLLKLSEPKSPVDKMEVDDVSCIRSLGGLSEILNEVQGDEMSSIMHVVALSS